jgi:outer membrane murein-binding lipoprotein Lpp
LLSTDNQIDEITSQVVELKNQIEDLEEKINDKKYQDQNDIREIENEWQT